MNTQINTIFTPLTTPLKMNGKIKARVCIKDDFVRTDGTSAIYIQLYLNGERKKINLGLSVKPSSFDKKKGRVRGKSDQAKDYNIVIEKRLAEISKIEVSYRLSETFINMETLIKELTNPTPKFDFIKFWEAEMENQKKFLKPGTYRQQKSTLTKIKKWKETIPFSSIDENLLKELQAHCKRKLKNSNTTIQTTLKNFKKYLHIANKKGIKTPLEFDDIKVKTFKGDRTFLSKVELKRMYQYWKSEFINDTHKKVLSKFLFSCFTSLRISDIQSLTKENIIDNTIVYVSTKTEKFNRIKLSKTASEFINLNEGPLFQDKFTPEHINETLKEICKILQIQKKVTFHVARHTFATQFIINGGNVVKLQSILDHANIRETMIYVHIAKAVLDEQIDLMDNLLH